MELSLLPSDDIEKICERLDDKSLARFMNSSSRIHQICFDIYSRRHEEYLEEEKRQEQIILNLHQDKNLYFEVWLDPGKEHPYQTSFWSNSLSNFLKTNVGKNLRTKPNYIYIHKIRTFGEPEAIKRYLKLNGLNNKSINEMMKTSVLANS